MPDFLRVVKKFLSQKARLQVCGRVCVCVGGGGGGCMGVCVWGVFKSLHPPSPTQDCVQVYHAVKRLPALADVLSSHEGQHRYLVHEVFQQPVKVGVVMSHRWGRWVMSP